MRVNGSWLPLGCLVLYFAAGCVGKQRGSSDGMGTPNSAGAAGAGGDDGSAMDCGATGSLAMVDYFRPMPAKNMTRDTWGAPGVLPRDIDNGLEGKGPDPDFTYWDGKIVVGPDGKYHMFASRWLGSQPFDDWGTSVAVHAVSDAPEGPYVDTGPIYSDRGGAGHNITGGALPDGGFFVVASDAGRHGDIFVSETIDGPFTLEGTITMDANGEELGDATANVSIIVRPDGDFLLVSRPGIIMLSKSGILGPYVAQGPSVWPSLDGYDNSKAEDPTIWYSGGLYHITVNYWDIHKARHLVSRNGLSDWTDTGLAYDPSRGFGYTDGTRNVWQLLERPGVLLEDGEVTHVTFAALDVQKWEDRESDGHASKVLVVPFDGACFDAALEAGMR